MLLPVILSGGAGTRLWPVSRRAYPKPFMALADGTTLIHKTLQRALGLGDHVFTVTSRDYYFITRDAYQAVAGFAADQHRFILEPSARNTAPAVVIAALVAQAEHGDHACLLVLPSDHLIADEDAFAQAVKQAQMSAEQGNLVTFGIKPTHAETGFGYLHRGQADGDAYEVVEFIEKPDLATAKQYFASDDFWWNSGMFCFRADAIIEAFAKHAPELLAGARACLAAADGEPLELPAEAFAALESISIDYAIMEKADNVRLIPGDFGWSDIGSWKAMAEIYESDEYDNGSDGARAVFVDSRRCYVRGNQRLVAAVGVQNLVVIDTEDAVLIADRERAQDVKAVVNELAAQDDESITFHQTVHRPWGSYTVLEDAEDCKVKRLVVKPGQVLSLQRHQHRSEHWTVVDGTAKVRLGDDEFLLEQNKSVYIPVNTLHRLENPGDEDIALIEVQTGRYFGEDDIERFEDVYGRV